MSKYPCRYCKRMVHSSSNLVKHERSCLDNPAAYSATRRALEVAPGLACGPREYMARRVHYPGAISLQLLRDQTGGNDWRKVAEEMTLRYEGTTHTSAGSDEWRALDRSPRVKSGEWLEAEDWFEGLRCRHKDLRERVYLMPNGKGLRVVTDVYEVR